MNGIPTDCKLTAAEAKEFSDVFQKTLCEISILDSVYGGCSDVGDFVKNVFRTCLEDLKHFGTLKTLAAAIDNIEHQKVGLKEHGDLRCVRLHNDGPKLLCQGFLNDKQLLQQYESLETNLQLLQRNEEEIDSIIEKCTDDGECTAIRRETEKNYVKKWEKARVEKFKLKFEIEELELQKKISELHAKLETEQIIDEEKEKFLNYCINKLKKKIEYWESKYKIDIMNINEKLENCLMTLKDKTKEVENLKKTFNERQIIIEEHVKNKQKLEEEKKINDHKEKMATKIQAWWRGTMVRRRLGPYKNLMGPRKKSIKKSIKSKKTNI